MSYPLYAELGAYVSRGKLLTGRDVATLGSSRVYGALYPRLPTEPVDGLAGGMGEQCLAHPHRRPPPAGDPGPHRCGPTPRAEACPNRDLSSPWNDLRG